MELSIEDLGDLVLARISGDLGRSSLSPQRDQVIAAIDRQTKPALLIDVSASTEVDSLGLGFLAAVQRYVSSRGGAFGLTGLTAEVESLLNQTGLDRVLPVHESTEDFRATLG